MFPKSNAILQKIHKYRSVLFNLQSRIKDTQEEYVAELCSEAQGLVNRWVLLKTVHGQSIYHCTGISRYHSTDRYTGEPILSTDSLNMSYDAMGFEQQRSGQWVCDDLESTETHSFDVAYIRSAVILDPADVATTYNYHGSIK